MKEKEPSAVVCISSKVRSSESPLLYACELWVFAMCPVLQGSTVSYAGDAHFPKHSLEYSLNFWSQSKKKVFHQK